MYDTDLRHRPIYMMKVDIGDGFYRVGMAPEDVPSLGLCLPPGPGGKTLVAFPLVLPMGWVESPPHFFAVTETVADLANTALREKIGGCARRIYSTRYRNPPYLVLTARYQGT